MKSYDVIAVNYDTRKVRIIASSKTDRNAAAIVNMAVIRRGVEEEFFVEVPTGKYKEGDKYEG